MPYVSKIPVFLAVVNEYNKTKNIQLAQNNNSRGGGQEEEKSWNGSIIQNDIHQNLTKSSGQTSAYTLTDILMSVHLLPVFLETKKPI